MPKFCFSLFLIPTHVKFINKFYPKIVYPESIIFPVLHLFPNPNHCHLSPGLLCFSPNWSSCLHPFCNRISTPQPKFSFFIFDFILLENNWFTILCWFLPYIPMNHPPVYMCTLPPEPPSHLPRAYYPELSKSERERQISYINACIWNLERWN